MFEFFGALKYPGEEKSAFPTAMQIDISP